MKSTWKEFTNEAKLGLAYCGSSFNKTLEQSLEFAKDLDNTELYADRLLIGGSSVLQFKTDRETVSRLDKKGKVYREKNCFIIDDGEVIVAYAIPQDRTWKFN